MPLSFTPDNFVTFTVDFDRWDGPTRDNGRMVYKTSITVDGLKVYAAADLRSGTCSAEDPPRLAEMLSTFFSFLSAWAEANEYAGRTGSPSENVDLFPADLYDTLGSIGADDFGSWADEVYSAE